MKKNKIFAMLFSLALGVGFVGCSDDDPVLTELEQPEVVNTKATYNSLSFEWNKIDDAIQYGYQLVDGNDNPVYAGVTYATKVTISQISSKKTLDPDTEYTLKVWPFAGLNVNYSAPPAATVTAKTDPIIQLEAPEVTITIDGNKAIIKWNKVANAETYAYTVMLNGEKLRDGEISSMQLTLRNLADGEYTFNVQANTTDGAYSSSVVTTETFQIGEVVIDTWSVSAEYENDTTGETYNVTLTKNEDGSFTIENFWGYPGYNLDFEVDAEGYANITNVELVDGYPNYGYLAASSSIDLWVWLTPGYNYSPVFDGDKDGGSFAFGYYDEDNEWRWDTMWWEGESTRSGVKKFAKPTAPRR